ncbi:MAG: LCP family protein [Acutalibacteraceae bacterium]|nr:LCP family protein [Acutalibacteraceae bacterium]
MKRVISIILGVLLIMCAVSCSKAEEPEREVISQINVSSAASSKEKAEPVYETSGGLDIKQLGISKDFKYNDSNIKNIALFGIDYSENDTSRCDSIMIISVDTKKKTAKISSVLRDSYVPIDLPDGDVVNTKINASYYYGSIYKLDGYKTSGPQLAINTLNQVYDLNIKDYISVNFKQAEKVIDYLGGIDIKISEAERNNMNNMDYGKLYDNGCPVEESGNVHLNGMQSVQYARVRQIDSDVIRTQRQRNVLKILLNKIKNLSADEVPKFVETMLDTVKTSFDYETIINYADLITDDTSFTANTFPVTDSDNEYYQYTYGGIYDGQWVWLYDTDLTTAYIHNFIYNEDISDIDTSWRY